MQLYIKLTGADALSRAFGRLTPEIQRALTNVVRETATEVVDGARARVHVKSGELKTTIRAEFVAGGMVALILAGYGSLKRGSRAKGKRQRAIRLAAATQEPGVYAMVEEFGSKHQNRPAHPFLFPALEAAKPNFERKALAALDPAMEKAIHDAGADK